MSGLEIAIFALIALVALLFAGIVLFAVWSLFYWITWTLRWHRRRHLYVRVTAEVTRAWYPWWSMSSHRGMGMLWLRYEHEGKQVHNRLTVSARRAKQAQTSGIVQLMIDPEYLKDAVLMER